MTPLVCALFWGFPKGGFMRGQISIIGIVRAPVAIINFASDPSENLCVYIGFQQSSHTENAQLIIATGVRTTPIIEICPLTTPPSETPKTGLTTGGGMQQHETLRRVLRGGVL